MIEVLASGPQATVQDLGRPGWAALGVPRSGAFDVHALRAANRLVGNREDAAGIEITLGGLALRFARAVTVALTGAACPGAPGWYVPLSLPAGAELHLGVPPAGLRSYLAVRGGVAVDPVLGSRSTDLLGGLGPAPLRPGDRLPIGADADGEIETIGHHGVPPPDAPVVLPIVWGPRDDWFAPAAREALLAGPWQVRGDADRIGLRLDGPVLARARAGELPSEPTLPGAVQVPPHGRPILFGPDAPVTGGYPVIAVVDDIGPAAQLRPGDAVRFVGVVSRGSRAAAR